MKRYMPFSSRNAFSRARSPAFAPRRSADFPDSRSDTPKRRSGAKRRFTAGT
ncbi:MAG: hypothetical protein M5U08_05130 [Burkholderiales bacterium]|nr:hypothetical protein [Burkholderiales bacterium]